MEILYEESRQVRGIEITHLQEWLGTFIHASVRRASKRISVGQRINKDPLQASSHGQVHGVRSGLLRGVC